MKYGILPLTLVVLASPAGAQLRELQPGARVRVSAPEVLGARLEATIVARRGDTLSLVPRGTAPVELPISSLSQVEMYRGKSRLAGAKRGLLWGLAIGLPLGAVSTAGDNKDWNQVDDTCDPALKDCATYSDLEQVAVITAGSAMLGAGIGAIIGKSRWERLQRPTPALSIVPSRGLVRVQLSFRF
jgi:hypothetical protein